MLKQIGVILVETSHPGNIGAVARAMKNMGVEQLCLVNPLNFPSDEAFRRSSGAHDILQQAQIFATLSEAVEEYVWVVGASARARTLPWPVCTPKGLMAELKKNTAQGRVALVFGRENSGLSNDELQHCHRHVHIPSNPSFASLNLAMAVQVLCYEVYQQHLSGHTDNQASAADQLDTVSGPNDPGWDELPATAGQVENFFAHLETTLIDIGFHNPDKPRQLMPRLRRLFQRVHLDRMEVNILRGILKAAQVAAGSLPAGSGNNARIRRADKSSP